MESEDFNELNKPENDKMDLKQKIIVSIVLVVFILLALSYIPDSHVYFGFILSLLIFLIPIFLIYFVINLLAKKLFKIDTKMNKKLKTILFIIFFACVFILLLYTHNPYVFFGCIIQLLLIFIPVDIIVLITKIIMKKINENKKL